MSHSLTINNKRIFDFYDEHKNLNFENMNLILVEILENLLKNTNPTLDMNVAASLLESVKGLQGKINNIEDVMNKNLNDISNVFTLKFIDFKKEYMTDLQLILSNNANEKVAPLIKEYNESLLDKTKIMFGEIIPKNQESLYKSIEGSLRTLQESVNKDTNLLIKSSLSKEVLQDYISKLDEKFGNTLLNTQNVLNTIVSSSEQRIDQRLGEIKDCLLYTSPSPRD